MGGCCPARERLHPLGFLTSPWLRCPPVILVTLWKGPGLLIGVFLAGLQSIPLSSIESGRPVAAKAGGGHTDITLRLCRPYYTW